MRKRTHGESVPHYVVKIAEAYANGLILPGSVGPVIVRHDDDCALLKGRGKCDCEPDIELSYPRVSK